MRARGDRQSPAGIQVMGEMNQPRNATCEREIRWAFQPSTACQRVEFAVIIDGTDGDEVAVSGLPSLSDGSSVKVAATAANEAKKVD